MKEILRTLKIQAKIIYQNPTFILLPGSSKVILTGIKDHSADKVLGSEYLNIYINEASELSFKVFSILKTRLSQKVYDQKGFEGINKIYIDCNPTFKNHYFSKSRTARNHICIAVKSQ